MVSTVFRNGKLRSCSLSRDESRGHINSSHSYGEAKFCLKPSLELDCNNGLNFSRISVLCLVGNGHLSAMKVTASTTLMALALGLASLFSPPPVKASPCLLEQFSGGYCYRWYDYLGLSLIDSVVIYNQGNGYVTARTPLGRATGEWVGRGDAVLVTGTRKLITCTGIATTSRLAGRSVNEGVCAEN